MWKGLKIFLEKFNFLIFYLHFRSKNGAKNTPSTKLKGKNNHGFTLILHGLRGFLMLDTHFQLCR